jgi:hypothetical protein
VQPAKGKVVKTPRVDRRYVFLSYKREEVGAARQVRDGLGRAGYVVWWDENVQCGQEWARRIDLSLQDAGCTVVLWSARSLGSPWVRHEASKAMALGTYAPCRIDPVAIDAPFDQVQASDLTNWDGKDKHPGFLGLLSRVAELLPPERTPARKLRDWVIDHAMTLGAVAFAAAALLILVWQTTASQRLISSLGDLEKSSKEAALGIERARYPINRIAAEVAVSLPVEGPRLTEYRGKLTKCLDQLQSAAIKYKTARELGLILLTDTKEKKLSRLDIRSRSPLFPKEDTPENDLFAFSKFSFWIFREPIQPEKFDPTNSERDPDLFVEAEPRMEGPGTGLRFSYDVREQRMETRGSLNPDPNDWVISKDLTSLPDLRGAQLFFAFDLDLLDEETKTFRKQLRLKLIRFMFGMQTVYVPLPRCQQMQTRDGDVYWWYRFDQDL